MASIAYHEMDVMAVLLLVGFDKAKESLLYAVALGFPVLKLNQIKVKSSLKLGEK